MMRPTEKKRLKGEIEEQEIEMRSKEKAESGRSDDREDFSPPRP